MESHVGHPKSQIVFENLGHLSWNIKITSLISEVSFHGNSKGVCVKWDISFHFGLAGTRIQNIRRGAIHFCFFPKGAR